MTFTKYYIDQLKDIPVLFREAKRDKILPKVRM